MLAYVLGLQQAVCWRCSRGWQHHVAHDAAASDKRHSGLKESSKLEQSRFLPLAGEMAVWIRQHHPTSV